MNDQKKRQPMPRMVERECACGCKFKARAVDVARGWADSCSKSCASRAREAKARAAVHV